MRSRRRTYLDINYSQPVNWRNRLNAGLVSWWLTIPHWRGTQWRDLCNRNHGTLTNMDPATDWVSARGRPGGFGCLEFVHSASDEHVSVPTTTMLEVFSNPFTVSFWIKAPGTTSYEAIWSKSANIGINRNGTTGGLYFVMTGGSGVLSFSSPSVFDATWHHVLWTYTGDASTCYVDGKLAATVARTGTPTGGGTTALGIGKGDGGNKDLTGLLDGFCLFNRGVTSSEAAALYYESRLGNPSTLNWISPVRYFDAGGGGGGGNPWHYYAQQAG